VRLGGKAKVFLLGTKMRLTWLVNAFHVFPSFAIMGRVSAVIAGNLL